MGIFAESRTNLVTIHKWNLILLTRNYPKGIKKNKLTINKQTPKRHYRKKKKSFNIKLTDINSEKKTLKRKKELFLMNWRLIIGQGFSLRLTRSTKQFLIQ